MRAFAKIPSPPDNPVAKKLHDLSILHYLQPKDPQNIYRATTYMNACSAIEYEHQRGKIFLPEDYAEIDGIGKQITLKIKEYLKKGYITKEREIRKRLTSEKIASLLTFTSIYGVGPKSAIKIYNAGFRTIKDIEEDLEKNLSGKSILTARQIKGLKYHQDLKHRIPRDEIDQFWGLLEDIFGKIHEENRRRFPEIYIEDEMLWTIGGSYRRGCADSGDIDIAAVQYPDCPNVIDQLIRYLENYGMLLEIYTHSTTKFEGVIKIRSIARKLDIFTSPAASWAFMLVHITGSKQLNIKLRRKAWEMGLELNEIGLYDKVTGMYVLQTDRESDIFKWLGFEYIPPDKRHIEHISKISSSCCTKTGQDETKFSLHELHNFTSYDIVSFLRNNHLEIPQRITKHIRYTVMKLCRDGNMITGADIPLLNHADFKKLYLGNMKPEWQARDRVRLRRKGFSEDAKLTSVIRVHIDCNKIKYIRRHINRNRKNRENCITKHYQKLIK